jgi:hypothetical protein
LRIGEAEAVVLAFYLGECAVGVVYGEGVLGEVEVAGRGGDGFGVGLDGVPEVKLFEHLVAFLFEVLAEGKDVLHSRVNGDEYKYIQKCVCQIFMWLLGPMDAEYIIGGDGTWMEG